MLSLAEYVGPHANSPDWTDACAKNAADLLTRVNSLLIESGLNMKNNPATKSLISGVKYGGFRPQNCQQGAATSSHKTGKGVDVFDPDNSLDKWLDANESKLAEHGLYREAPSETLSWTHLTTRAPKSGKRTFYP